MDKDKLRQLRNRIDAEERAEARMIDENEESASGYPPPIRTEPVKGYVHRIIDILLDDEGEDA